MITLSWLTKLPFDFAHPYVLLLVLLLPVWWFLRATRRPPAITFSRAHLVAQGPKRGSFYPKLLFILRNVVLLALIITVARPRIPKHQQKVQTQGINIAIAIDLSSSMLAQDFQPKNRLEVAKQNMRQFVLDRSSDRIGIVAFASEAVTQVPLTTDYPILLQRIDDIQVGQLDDGTAIGDGLATAVNRLKDAPGKSKVIIIMTDGVNNRGNIDPNTAAQAAVTYGIKVYAIGIGTIGRAPFPVGKNKDGSVKLEYQDVTIDDSLLTHIATMTGGQYFRATNASALKQVYAQINSLERTHISARTNVRYTELFRWPLAIAIVALLFDILIGAVRAPLP